MIFITYLVHHQVYKLSLHWNPFYRSIFCYMRWLGTFISTLSVHLNCQVSNYACPHSLLTRQAVTSFPSLVRPKIINLNLLRTHGRKEHRKRFFKNFPLNLSIKRIFQIWKSGWCRNESRTLITWLQLYHLPSVKAGMTRHQPGVNTLKPKQKGRHVAIAIFKCIFVDENLCVFYSNSTVICFHGCNYQWVNIGPDNDWVDQSANHYLNQWGPSLLMHINVTRFQWANSLTWLTSP